MVGCCGRLLVETSAEAAGWQVQGYLDEAYKLRVRGRSTRDSVHHSLTIRIVPIEQVGPFPQNNNSVSDLTGEKLGAQSFSIIFDKIPLIE